MDELTNAWVDMSMDEQTDLLNVAEIIKNSVKEKRSLELILALE